MEVKENVVEADKEIKEADKITKSNTKKIIFLSVLVAIIVIIVVVIVVFATR